eukprot:7349803-Ditylum_brightwellii.AAC.1
MTQQQPRNCANVGKVQRIYCNCLTLMKRIRGEKRPGRNYHRISCVHLCTLILCLTVVSTRKKRRK